MRSSRYFLSQARVFLVRVDLSFLGPALIEHRHLQLGLLVGELFGKPGIWHLESGADGVVCGHVWVWSRFVGTRKTFLAPQRRLRRLTIIYTHRSACTSAVRHSIAFVLAEFASPF